MRHTEFTGLRKLMSCKGLLELTEQTSIWCTELLELTGHTEVPELAALTILELTGLLELTVHTLDFTRIPGTLETGLQAKLILQI